MNAVRLAISWLTVAPVGGPSTVDRHLAGRAITLAPLVGLLLGAGTAAALWVFDRAGLTSALAGLLAVGLLALGTRGMHLDGLADTADGLGSYGPPERARQIMKSGAAGPFGVAALIFAIGIQAFAFAALVDERRWAAIVCAVALGRVAVVIACRRGVPAAPESGFGTLVAGTQPLAPVICWPVLALAGCVFAVPGNFWLGPVVVVGALAGSLLVARHCVRRFGGLSGDVLGATVEITSSLAALGFSSTL
ncbi:adenosylcobinamide-GDP ribazoletransferase [Nocardia caishijiensis]|uniref:Adenosylcobinamide-GDP ribazoletransferase n=1 Tax=Nocardia caishijiensis TaxID=184756 RepID=A0ABQ6YFX9_9NOCA|nr:adenosylcobinamide-GDP ribazoletransferase [Nocardia caishijiensis]KAF0842527.1 cobalamin-5'-phosphate synthase [Nocardia caishijiensis]